MFFTVKQYSHIRGRTRISCHVRSAYLPLPSSTPQGSVTARLPVTPVNVCEGGGGDTCRPVPLSSLTTSDGCGEINAPLLLWVCLTPLPSPVGLWLGVRLISLCLATSHPPQPPAMGIGCTHSLACLANSPSTCLSPHLSPRPSTCLSCCLPVYLFP